MNLAKLLVCLLLATLCYAVPRLSAEQFHAQLASEKPFVIKFFSPNCGQCIVMALEYQKLWENSQNSDYEIFQVDCTAQNALCEANEVMSYPTLKLFFNGVSFDYNGARTSDIMATWIKDALSSDLIELSAEQIGKRRQTENFVLVGGLGELSRKAIAIAAKLSRQNSVNIFYFKQSYFIRLFKASTREYIDYQTDQNFPKSLIEWAIDNNRDNILTLDDKALDYVKKQKSLSNLLGIIVENQFSEIQRKIISQFCQDNFKKILCFSLDKSSKVYESLEETLKVAKGQNKIILVDKTFNKGYHYPHLDIALQKLTAFHKDALQNKLQLAIDTERDIKQRIKLINVVKLTKSTYDKTITLKQFVFIEFYSTSCAHCIHFAPEYERVARHFKDHPNVAIAGVDVDEQNQLRIRESVHGYPHFRLYIRQNLVYYKRAIDADAMIQFINEAITTKIQEVSCTCSIRSPKPYITVQGIDQDSHLNMLPAIFKKYPIYLLTGRPQFKVKIHKHIVKEYQETQDIWQIADFLQIHTSPILVKLGQSQPSRKLQVALSEKKPILLIINKGERETVKQAISLLQTYCLDIEEFICGQLHKGDEDYEHLIKELGEDKSEGNSLFWVDLLESHYWKYRGDMENISQDDLDYFVQQMIGQQPNEGENKVELDQSPQEQL